MTSRRWVTVFSIVFLSLALATPGSARAQFGFQGIPGSPSVSQFGPSYGTGTAYGTSPYDYGSFGGASSGRPGGISLFPLPGYGRSIGRTPQTTTSFQPLYDVITGTPGWSGRGHRIHRRLR